jgi:antirestriction protein
MTTTTPRVWIGCLAAYNEGHLHGEWVDATDVDVMNEVLEHVLKTSPAHHAEEWFIADHEGFGDAIGEYTPFERVAALGALIEEHGEAFRAYLTWLDDADSIESDELEDNFYADYRGEWDSEKDFIYQQVDDLGAFQVCEGPTYSMTCITVPDDHVLVQYFDWDGYTEEQFRHGPYTSVKTSDYNVFVFEEGCR